MKRGIASCSARAKAAGTFVTLQAERANRRTVHGIEAVSEPLGLAVHDDVDVTLLPTRDGLAAVLRYGHEAQRREHAPERLRFLVARRELDELHAS